MIWSKLELNYFNTIFSNRAKLQYDDKLIKVVPASNTAFNIDNGLSLTEEELKEFEKLLNLEDEKAIYEVLKMASKIKVDPENRLHQGLITNLSNIDPTDKKEIFVVFKEIIAFYYRTLNKIIDRIFLSVGDLDNIKLTIEEIKKYPSITLEEELLNYEINRVLIYTNGIIEHNLVSNLINILDNSLKDKLITLMKYKLKNSYRKEAIQSEYLLNNYHKDIENIKAKKRFQYFQKRKQLAKPR